MVRPGAVLAGFGIAHPPVIHQDVLWRDFFAGHYAGVQKGFAQRIFANAGVVSRHAVINPTVEDVSRWSTRQRMERYLVEALPLGKEAIGRALDAASLDPGDIGLFVVCSCTGYVTPGVDILLARDLGMAASTQRLLIGHMGCYAALPGLSAASDFVVAQGRPALLLCVELPSLHVQPPARDPQQIIAHSLFSDAAGAVVLVAPDAPPAPGAPGRSAHPARPGYRLCEVTARTDTTTADQMTWDVTDLGFRMGLSPKVPDTLARHVGDVVDGLLDAHGLRRDDVDGWAVHPGGPRILDVVRDELGRAEADLAASRATLAAHGNCSSPTVLLIMEALLASGAAPRRVVVLAFGPGLTLYAALLERC
jgi:alkylresorcinol/alkylpyrone synthase